MLSRQSGPTVLAAHSYGGQVITSLGTDAPNVVGLVYIAGFGLDEGESIGALLQQGPPTPGVANVEVDSDGFGWIPEDDFLGHFAADIDPVKAKVMYAVQQPLQPVHVRRRDGHPRVEGAALVVSGRPERRGDPTRCRAAVRTADGRRHDRGRERTLRDGLPPGGDVRADRDRGEGRRPVVASEWKSRASSWAPQGSRRSCSRH